MTAEDQIRSAIESFGSAYRSKDLETLAGVYSEFLIKDRAGAVAERKGETTSRIQQVFRDFDTDIDVQVAEIEVSGDLAYVRGAFTVTLTPRAGQTPTVLERRYLEIWRNEAGCWRVTRTMDNEASPKSH
jgi:ketosteroid isomerase-like protein